jgi:hypothetical protein
MTIRPLFEWRDLWIGVFWDRKSRRLYVLPVPCLGLVVQFPRTVDPSKPLSAYDDRKLVEATVRQAADAAARLAILTGDQAPPRGFGIARIKGPNRRMADAARESLEAVLEGLRELHRRIR